MSCISPAPCYSKYAAASFSWLVFSVTIAVWVSWPCLSLLAATATILLDDNLFGKDRDKEIDLVWFGRQISMPGWLIACSSIRTLSLIPESDTEKKISQKCLVVEGSTRGLTWWTPRRPRSWNCRGLGWSKCSPDLPLCRCRCQQSPSATPGGCWVTMCWIAYHALSHVTSPLAHALHLHSLTPLSPLTRYVATDSRVTTWTSSLTHALHLHWLIKCSSVSYSIQIQSHRNSKSFNNMFVSHVFLEKTIYMKVLLVISHSYYDMLLNLQT